MSTKTYLGNPSAGVAEWIRTHTAPAAGAVTRIQYSGDESASADYEINEIDCSTPAD